ncbi:replication protein [Sphingobium sp. TB-6]|uniref:replication protein RepA n=1 Tax=Sphingobium sp. TB-6 TaxID=2728850 RepID=UPI00146BAA44|nr:replication protein RepA [Sphingobium sp. TB-6]NML92045.1 replication protein [Sphingobium sp. TB-6]
MSRDGSPLTLFEALPPNVLALSKEADRAAKTGHPDYLPAVLCQVGLPRSPTDGRTFERTSGNVSLQVEAGKVWDGKSWQQQPIPYGVRPRLALVHITTQAIRTNSRTVDVGGSVNAFLTELGLDNGGKAYGQMRQQMTALAACTLRLGRVDTRTIGGVERDFAVTLEAKPFRQFEAWIDSSGSQPSLWPTEVELTQEFFDSIRESAVPLEHRALAQLSHSALALDLYTWLAHRLHRVRKSGSRISWAALQEQFGTEYKDRKPFKLQFRKRLREALAAYPAAKVEEIDGGIMLHASPPPIPRTRAVVRKLPKP